MVDDVPDTPLEQARMLENILVAASEGQRTSNQLYIQLRGVLLDEPSIKPLLPSFVRTSRDLDHFWSYIKGQLPSLNAAFDPGGRRRRPRTSTAAAASVAPIARAPSSAPNRTIAKTKSPPAATSPSCGHQPLHQPGGPSRSRCAAPESRPPPPRDKERQLASRKCRRESTPQTRPRRLRHILVLLCAAAARQSRASGRRLYTNGRSPATTPPLTASVLTANVWPFMTALRLAFSVARLLT